MFICFVLHLSITFQDLDVIFSNILDIYEFTANLLSSVEEQVELAENAKPLVGICFQDMAEVRKSLPIFSGNYLDQK